MNTITLHGNLTANPELRFTPSGRAIANFSIAVNGRRFDRERQTWVDQRPVLHRVAVFGLLAENVAESLAQGMAVSVTGEFIDNSYRPAGSDQVVRAVQLAATDVAASLRWATAVITRNPRDTDRTTTGREPAVADRPVESDPVDDTPASAEVQAEPGTRRPAVRRAPSGPRRAAAA